MSTTQQSQPATAVASDATVQNPLVRPSQYLLTGDGISVSYFLRGSVRS